MKKPAKSKPEKHPAITQELHFRLAELEAELGTYPDRESGERPLKSVKSLAQTAVGVDPVIQFSLRDAVYAAGHSDRTFPGSNHARGVRRIRFYSEGKMVFEIEGDFENQQFGSNFRFQNIDLYTPGEWEADFVKLTDELRDYKAKRKTAFKKKRVAEQDRLARRRAS